MASQISLPTRGRAVRRRRTARRAKRELRYLLGSVIGNRSYDRFALLGHARTGSNLVVDGLVTSPEVRMYDELFAAHNRTAEDRFEDVARVLYRRQPRSVRVVGFKVFYYHLADDEWSELVKTAPRVIHLTRRNRLRTIASLAIATKTNRWTGTAGHVAAADKRVELDVSKLVEMLGEIEAQEERCERRCRSSEVLSVVYEDLVADPAREFGKIERFLGVDGIDPAKISLPRQNPEPLSALVENYDEVADRLSGTPYSWCLSE